MTPSRNNPVIANPAQLGVAIQSLDRLGTVSWSKRLDCFVAARLAMTTGDKA